MSAETHLRSSLFALVTLACLGAPAAAAVIHVPGDQPTIQAGVVVAAAGDTVLVAPGTYVGDGNRDISVSTAIIVQSAEGPELTVIQCDGGPGEHHRGFNISNDAVVDGFTITGGYWGGLYPYGGGMMCGTATVRNCILRDNSAQYGGGIWTSTGTIENCIFDANQGEDGAAIGNFEDVHQRGGSRNVQISGCVFMNHYDSVMAFENISIQVDRCTFVHNSGGLLGGVSGVSNSIIAYNDGGIECSTFSCTNMYGNTDGDWTGCNADQADVNDNFSADPLFCDLDGGDLTLHRDSPCLDAPGCGLIGAFGRGCGEQTVYVATWGSDESGDGSEGEPFATIEHGLSQAIGGDTVQIACGTYYEHDLEVPSGIILRSETGEPDCVTIDAGGLGRVIRCWEHDQRATIEGFTLTGGQAADYGGGIRIGLCEDPPEIRRCRVENNYASLRGGGVFYTDDTGGMLPLRVSECELIANVAGVEGAGLVSFGAPVEIEDTVFSHNSLESPYNNGVAIFATPSVNQQSVLRRCTIAGNAGLDRGAILWGNSATATLLIENSIIAQNEGSSIVCFAGAVQVICSNVFGNTGGDWTDGIVDQEDVNGNFSADPLFCYLAGGDVTLHTGSPCLDVPGCGLVGARGQGCGTRTWYVANSGSDETGDGTVANPFASIGKGLVRAFPADTVQVAHGTYYEHDLEVPSGIVLRGDTGTPGCVTIDANGAGRVLNCQFFTLETVVEGFTLTGGVDSYGAAINALYCYDHLIIRDCVVAENRAHSNGGGIFFSTGGSSRLRIFRCEFASNRADRGGGIYCGTTQLELEDCTFWGNTATQDLGSAVYLIPRYGAQSVFWRCTFASNHDHQPVLYVDSYNANQVSLENSIIAFNDGASVQSQPGVVTLSCCDVFGNEGGDWVDDIADQEGINGNVSIDPLFCDWIYGDLHLQPESPCLAIPGCDQIGAWGTGCDFAISAITDVGNDQGLQVRVRWARSSRDVFGSITPILSYTLFRRVDQYKGAVELDRSNLDEPAIPYPPGDWDIVSTVPAWGEDEYLTICPTLCDATAGNGICWSMFFIRANTETPAVFFDTEPDSGYSVDNIEPPAPTSFAVAYGDQNDLVWEESGAPDLAWYEVHRDAVADFEPVPENLVHQTSATSWTDPGGNWHDHYLLMAVDDAGNRSEPLQPNHISAVSNAVPERTNLVGSYPNPFNPITTVVFTLAERSLASLLVFDLRGRIITQLLSGVDWEPGRYEIVWNGRDDAGRQVASGTYFYRLEAGSYSETKRMVLIK